MVQYNSGIKRKKLLIKSTRTNLISKTLNERNYTDTVFSIHMKFQSKQSIVTEIRTVFILWKERGNQVENNTRELSRLTEINLYLVGVIGYTGIYIYQNSLNCACRFSVFYCMQIMLQQKENFPLIKEKNVIPIKILCVCVCIKFNKLIIKFIWHRGPKKARLMRKITGT